MRNISPGRPLACRSSLIVIFHPFFISNETLKFDNALNAFWFKLHVNMYQLKELTFCVDNSRNKISTSTTYHILHKHKYIIEVHVYTHTHSMHKYIVINLQYFNTTIILYYYSALLLSSLSQRAYKIKYNVIVRRDYETR